MATETDICNLAVRRLGEMALLVDVNENSTYAEVAKQSYPIVRDALLERHAWNFATTRVRGQLLAEKPIGWQFGYKGAGGGRIPVSGAGGLPADALGLCRDSRRGD